MDRKRTVVSAYEQPSTGRYNVPLLEQCKVGPLRAAKAATTACQANGNQRRLMPSCTWAHRIELASYRTVTNSPHRQHRLHAGKRDTNPHAPG